MTSICQYYKDQLRMLILGEIIEAHICLDYAIVFYSKILSCFTLQIQFFLLIIGPVIILYYTELQTLAWFSCLPCPKSLVKYYILEKISS